MHYVRMRQLVGELLGSSEFFVEIVTTGCTETPLAEQKAAKEKTSSKCPAAISSPSLNGVHLSAMCPTVSFLLHSVSRERGLRRIQWFSFTMLLH